MTTASDLRTLITVQRRATGADELGQPVAGWEQHVQLRADVRHVSGTETAKASSSISAVRASARVRTRTDITPAMRLLIGGAAYSVQAIVPVEDGRDWMDIVCEATA